MSLPKEDRETRAIAIIKREKARSEIEVSRLQKEVAKLAAELAGCEETAKGEDPKEDHEEDEEEEVSCETCVSQLPWDLRRMLML